MLKEGGLIGRVLIVIVSVILIVAVYKFPHLRLLLTRIFSYEVCDLDRDRNCNESDYRLLLQTKGMCAEDQRFVGSADFDRNGCITQDEFDKILSQLRKYQQ